MDSDKVEGTLKEKEGEITGDEDREKQGESSEDVGRGQGKGRRPHGRRLADDRRRGSEVVARSPRRAARAEPA